MRDADVIAESFALTQTDKSGLSASDQSFLRHTLNKSGLSILENLAEETCTNVLASMKSLQLQQGDVLIERNQSVSGLYIVQRGLLRDGTKTVSAGDVVGPPSLLVETVSDVTIRCTSAEAKVWHLQRQAFRTIVAQGEQATHGALMSALASVPLLASLAQADLRRIASVAQLVSFSYDQVIIRKGEHGDAFYLLKSGSVVCTCIGGGGVPDAHIEAGGYFGERALLYDEPRAANVIAASKVVECYRIDRATFTTVLGPFRDMMDRSVLLHTLSDLPVLQDVPAPVLREIANEFQTRSYASGTTLVRRGDPCEALFVVKRGAVEIHLGQAEQEHGGVTVDPEADNADVDSMLGDADHADDAGSRGRRSQLDRSDSISDTPIVSPLATPAMSRTPSRAEMQARERALQAAVTGICSPVVKSRPMWSRRSSHHDRHSTASSSPAATVEGTPKVVGDPSLLQEQGEELALDATDVSEEEPQSSVGQFWGGEGLSSRHVLLTQDDDGLMAVASDDVDSAVSSGLDRTYQVTVIALGGQSAAARPTAEDPSTPSDLSRSLSMGSAGGSGDGVECFVLRYERLYELLEAYGVDVTDLVNANEGKSGGAAAALDTSAMSTVADSNVAIAGRMTSPLPTLEASDSSGAMATPVDTGGVAVWQATPIVDVINRLKEIDERRKLSLRDFRPVKTLGVGAFGRVRLVQHKVSGQVYALKEMKKSVIVKLKQQRNVSNEKLVMETVRHPNLVRLVKCFRDSTSIYLLTEVALGGELFSLLTREHRLSLHSAQFYTSCIVLGLQALHAHSIVYRDLKPENVLLNGQGYAVLTDFGFARKLEDRTYTLCGTPEYMSPEIILGTGYGLGADYWAIGILLYEMLVGHTPFTDFSGKEDRMVVCQNVLTEKLRFPKHMYPKSDPGDEWAVARRLLRELLHKDPLQRLGSTQRGIKDIADHPFFARMDFSRLLHGKLVADWVPDLNDGLDTRYFDDYEVEDQEMMDEAEMSDEEHNDDSDVDEALPIGAAGAVQLDAHSESKTDAGNSKDGMPQTRPRLETSQSAMPGTDSGPLSPNAPTRWRRGSVDSPVGGAGGASPTQQRLAGLMRGAGRHPNGMQTTHNTPVSHAKRTRRNSVVGPVEAAAMSGQAWVRPGVEHSSSPRHAAGGGRHNAATANPGAGDNALGEAELLRQLAECLKRQTDDWDDVFDDDMNRTIKQHALHVQRQASARMVAQQAQQTQAGATSQEQSTTGVEPSGGSSAPGSVVSVAKHQQRGQRFRDRMSDEADKMRAALAASQGQTAAATLKHEEDEKAVDAGAETGQDDSAAPGHDGANDAGNRGNDAAAGDGGDAADDGGGEDGNAGGNSGSGDDDDNDPNHGTVESPPPDSPPPQRRSEDGEEEERSPENTAADGKGTAGPSAAEAVTTPATPATPAQPTSSGTGTGSGLRSRSTRSRRLSQTMRDSLMRIEGMRKLEQDDVLRTPAASPTSALQEAKGEARAQSSESGVVAFSGARQSTASPNVASSPSRGSGNQPVEPAARPASRRVPVLHVDFSNDSSPEAASSATPMEQPTPAAPASAEAALTAESPSALSRGNRAEREYDSQVLGPQRLGLASIKDLGTARNEIVRLRTELAMALDSNRRQAELQRSSERRMQLLESSNEALRNETKELSAENARQQRDFFQALQELRLNSRNTSRAASPEPTDTTAANTGTDTSVANRESSTSPEPAAPAPHPVQAKEQPVAATPAKQSTGTSPHAAAGPKVSTPDKVMTSVGTSTIHARGTQTPEPHGGTPRSQRPPSVRTANHPETSHGAQYEPSVDTMSPPSTQSSASQDRRTTGVPSMMDYSRISAVSTVNDAPPSDKPVPPHLRYRRGFETPKERWQRYEEDEKIVTAAERKAAASMRASRQQQWAEEVDIQADQQRSETWKQMTQAVGAHPRTGYPPNVKEDEETNAMRISHKLLPREPYADSMLRDTDEGNMSVMTSLMSPRADETASVFRSSPVAASKASNAEFSPHAAARSAPNAASAPATPTAESPYARTSQEGEAPPRSALKPTASFRSAASTRSVRFDLHGKEMPRREDDGSLSRSGPASERSGRSLSASPRRSMAQSQQRNSRLGLSTLSTASSRGSARSVASSHALSQTGSQRSSRSQQRAIPYPSAESVVSANLDTQLTVHLSTELQAAISNQIAHASATMHGMAPLPRPPSQYSLISQGSAVSRAGGGSITRSTEGQQQLSTMSRLAQGLLTSAVHSESRRTSARRAASKQSGLDRSLLSESIERSKSAIRLAGDALSTSMLDDDGSRNGRGHSVEPVMQTTPGAGLQRNGSGGTAPEEQYARECMEALADKEQALLDEHDSKRQPEVLRHNRNVIPGWRTALNSYEAIHSRYRQAQPTAPPPPPGRRTINRPAHTSMTAQPKPYLQPEMTFGDYNSGGKRPVYAEDLQTRVRPHQLSQSHGPRVGSHEFSDKPISAASLRGRRVGAGELMHRERELHTTHLARQASKAPSTSIHFEDTTADPNASTSNVWSQMGRNTSKARSTPSKALWPPHIRTAVDDGRLTAEEADVIASGALQQWQLSKERTQSSGRGRSTAQQRSDSSMPNDVELSSADQSMQMSDLSPDAEDGESYGVVDLGSPGSQAERMAAARRQIDDLAATVTALEQVRS